MEKYGYEMIMKRKSFHMFNLFSHEKIELSQLEEIKNKFKELQPLEKEIKIEMQILPAEQTTCKRGQEYCIMLYSEKKDNYLQNIGYVGEQLDLYLTYLNIGTLWFGMGKAEQTEYKGCQFVIMMAIKKVPSDKFRKDLFKTKRKSVEKIWYGDPIENVTNLVRFAPSACNSQPWIVERKNDSLSVFRYKAEEKNGMMPMKQIVYFNQIDIGIFLVFLELCLQHEKHDFNRENFYDGKDIEKTLVATYKLY